VKVIELDTIDPGLRDQMLAATSGPVIITEHDRPLLVIRSLLDDDAADELIAEQPEFQESIRRARQQAAHGQVKTLAELREQYSSERAQPD
jgi:hypothetical protein